MKKKDESNTSLLLLNQQLQEHKRKDNIKNSKSSMKK